MARMLTCFVFGLAISSVHGYAVLHGGRAFLGASMQPEIVAHTLVSVEEEWKAQAAVAVQCNMSTSGGVVNCSDASVDFTKSCSRVLGAIVQGSSGDLSVAEEYMTDVCSQPIITGLHRQHCVLLAQILLSGLTADSYENRVNFKSESSCTDLWNNLVDEERNAKVLADAKRQTEEKAAHEATAKKMAEAEKVAREAAEIAKQAEEKAAQEAAAKKKEAEQKVVQNSTKQVENKADGEEVKHNAREGVVEKRDIDDSKSQKEDDAVSQTQSEAEKVAKAAEEKINEVDQMEHSHEEEMANLTAKIFNASTVREHMDLANESNTVVVVRSATNQTSSGAASVGEK